MKKSISTNVLFFVLAIALFSCSGPPDVQIQVTHVATWGETGSKPGQLLHPIGITISDHKLFVSDAGNHRIQVFDKQGNFISAFGNNGEEKGELNRPMHLDAANATIYVPEYLNDRIQVFSRDGLSRKLIGTSGIGKGGFDAPGGVAVDTLSSTLLVADFYNHLIQRFSLDGTFIEQYGKGSYGSEPGVFTYPTDVALLSDGRIVVADAYNNRIQLLATDGSPIWMVPDTTTQAGTAPKRFDVATAVATDYNDRIYAVDFENHRIKLFSSKGRFLTEFGTHGKEAGQFERPTDIAIDENGYLYVVDFGNNRIQKFKLNI